MTEPTPEITHFGNHTPGPWRRCGGNTANYIAIDSRDGYIVFEMADKGHTEHGEYITCPDDAKQFENAKLIALSPEMYDAIQLAITCLAGGFEVETADELAEKNPAAAGALRVLMPFIDDEAKQALKKPSQTPLSDSVNAALEQEAKSK